ncbi:MAG: class I SAM-dependent methyltransferase [Dehalococcoidia bacterium]
MQRFATLTENEALREAVADRIRLDGPMTFRDYMETALYHPQHGYYCAPREKMGHDGDYLTSPEVSPMFGMLVGQQVQEMWQAMGRPHRFEVVEMGAGSGALALDIMAWARRQASDFRQALSYRIVEVSEVLVDRQRHRLRAAEADLARVSWTPSLPEGVQGCFLSNELADSFPVHRVAVQDGELREVYVSWDGQRFLEELRPPSTPAIEEYFRRLGLLPGEGCHAEVNLQAAEWIAALARALEQGFVLTFDYGHQAAELYAPWRRQGTLLCFYRHNASNDPYARLGRQDMTSHLDFTTLARLAGENGLELLGLVSQTEFLSNLGIAEALRPPGEGEVSLEEYYARRRAVMELADPAGLGRLKVMVLSKGIGPCHLSGLEEGQR